MAVGDTAGHVLPAVAIADDPAEGVAFFPAAPPAVDPAAATVVEPPVEVPPVPVFAPAVVPALVVPAVGTPFGFDWFASRDEQAALRPTRTKRLRVIEQCLTVRNIRFSCGSMQQLRATQNPEKDPPTVLPALNINKKHISSNELSPYFTVLSVVLK